MKFSSLCSYGLVIIMMACSTPPATESPLSEADQRAAQNALHGLRVADDLEATLFASEPMLFNPTNMDIDDRGRIWVIEALNYRNFFNPGNPERLEGDRILILEDSNGDGKADKQTVFYQGRDIDAALGIAVIGNQVIVSSSPNVWVFTDANGDDKPEKKELLFTTEGGVQDDHGIHAFVFGPDGRYYFNHGNAVKSVLGKNGEPLYDKNTGQRIANIGQPYHQGMIYRCERDGSKLEVLAHNFRNNFEVTLDSYGSLWQSDNDDDGNQGVRINYVMEYGNYGYKDEKTGAGWQSYRTGMSDEIPLRHWHLNDPGVVPNLLQTGAGSPTGITFYEGTLLPAVYQQQMIHADAGPHVVRAYPTTIDGAGYQAKMENILWAEEDDWFRPSDVCVAPDGSLFVADWYDPGVGGNHMGDTLRGRIYRIAPSGSAYSHPTYTYDTPEGSIEALKSPNLSARSKGWLALYQMKERALPVLEALWQDGQPHERARALWLLAQLSPQASQLLQAAAGDRLPQIRITALRIARQLELDLAEIQAVLVNDNSPQVRREVAISLRFDGSAVATQQWAELALQSPRNDRWYLEALGIGSDLYAEPRFTAWQAQVRDKWHEPVGTNIIWRSRSKAAIPLLGQLIQDTPSLSASTRYFRAMDFQTDASKNDVLRDLLDDKHPQKGQLEYLVISAMDGKAVLRHPQSRRALNSVLDSLKGSDRYFDLVAKLQLTNQTDNLMAIALDPAAGNAAAKAARLLADLGQMKQLTQALRRADEEKTQAIFSALGAINNAEALSILEAYARDEQHPMALRKTAIRSLASSWNGNTRMVALLEENQLPYELGEVGASQLMQEWRAGYRTVASRYLNVEEKQSQHAPIHELVRKEGKLALGQKMYLNHCSNCHQVDSAGINFGPSLTEIGSKLSKDALYASILHPSAGISFGYEGWLLSLKDGSKVQGYITSRTDDAIDLKLMGGMVVSYAKADITNMERQEQSLMTEGLAKLMSEEELVSLVTYLSSLKKAPPTMASR